jgi:FkbM family methyltransferase
MAGTASDALARRVGERIRRALGKNPLRPSEDLVVLETPGGESLYARAGTSDLAAFEHVFGGAYEIDLGADPRLILDLGANVGYAAVAFALRYPRARVLAVEPEPGNVQLLRRNAAAFAGIDVIEGAVWPHDAALALEDPGKGRWGFRVREAGDRGTVRAVTVPQLIERAGGSSIDLMKIDIEGSELELFAEATSWLDQVGALVIELHDRFRPGCRDALDRALAGARPDFHETQRGEDVIFVRDDLVRPSGPLP